MARTIFLHFQNAGRHAGKGLDKKWLKHWSFCDIRRSCLKIKAITLV